MLWGEGEDKFSIESVCPERKRGREVESEWEREKRDETIRQTLLIQMCTKMYVR